MKSNIDSNQVTFVNAASPASITECDTEYLAVCDESARYEPRRIEQQLRVLEQNPELDVLGAAAYVCADDWTPKYVLPLFPSHVMVLWHSYVGIPFAWQSLVFRTEALRKAFEKAEVEPRNTQINFTEGNEGNEALDRTADRQVLQEEAKTSKHEARPTNHDHSSSWLRLSVLVAEAGRCGNMRMPQVSVRQSQMPDAAFRRDWVSERLVRLGLSKKASGVLAAYSAQSAVYQYPEVLGNQDLPAYTILLKAYRRFLKRHGLRDDHLTRHYRNDLVHQLLKRLPARLMLTRAGLTLLQQATLLAPQTTWKELRNRV